MWWQRASGDLLNHGANLLFLCDDAAPFSFLESAPDATGDSLLWHTARAAISSQARDDLKGEQSYDAMIGQPCRSESHTYSNDWNERWPVKRMPVVRCAEAACCPTRPEYRRRTHSCTMILTGQEKILHKCSTVRVRAFHVNMLRSMRTSRTDEARKFAGRDVSYFIATRLRL